MLENLPPEILQQIILNKSLDFRDVMNVASTCSYLRNFVMQNVCWKAKYVQMWPKIHEFAGYVPDYFAEIQHSYAIRKGAREILVGLATSCSRENPLYEEDFKPLSDLVASRYLNGEYITEYLKQIISNDTEVNAFEVDPLLKLGTAPLRYYWLTALRFLSHVTLLAEWNRFFSLHDVDQTLERAATMFVQWCRPQDEVTMEDVSSKLDAVTGKVIRYLKKKKPHHPLFTTDGNVLREWRERNIFKNKFSTEHCREILAAMSKQMDFFKNEDVYQEIDNSFITEVLESKQGVLITLAVIYESVARRLGVNLDPIITPTCFLLRFTEENTRNQKVFYINEFQEGRMFRSGARSYYRNLTFSRATTKQVVERMANNINVELPGHSQSIVGELNRTLRAYDIKTTDYLTSFHLKRRGLWRNRRRGNPAL